MKYYATLLLSSFLVLTGCDILGPGDSSGSSFIYTPTDSTEAYNAALWYSGDIEPSQKTVSLHLYNLKYIRSIFRDSVISVDIPFTTPWNVGEVLVKWDDTTAQKIRNGSYTGWNSLPPDLRPIDSTKMPFGLNWSALKFQKPFHPQRLSDTYKTLPGVITAEPNGRMYTLGYARVVPCLVDGKNSYYFYVTGVGGEQGDYFKVISGMPHYVGGWNSQIDSVPSWYNEVRYVVEHFETWDGY
jgi:hypothetical protein